MTDSVLYISLLSINLFISWSDLVMSSSITRTACTLQNHRGDYSLSILLPQPVLAWSRYHTGNQIKLSSQEQLEVSDKEIS